MSRFTKYSIYILPCSLGGCEGNMEMAWLFIGTVLLCVTGIGLWRRKARVYQAAFEKSAQQWTEERSKLQKNLTTLQEQQSLASLYWHHMLEELRTPLHGIQGFLHLSIQDHYGVPPSSLKPVLSTCLQLSGILRQDLESIAMLTQSEGHWLTVRASRYTLEQVLRELEPFLELQKQRHSDVRFRLKKLWSLDQSEFVQDLPKLLLVLRQILNHAFSQARNHQQTTITMAVQYRNRLLTCELSLEGNLTQAAMATSSPSSLTPHMPLALAFLKWLGGELRESHHPELGYRWTLLLPDAPVAEFLTPRPTMTTEAISVPLPSQTSFSAPSFHLDWQGDGPHILVVDDQALNCELIRELLLPHGYRVSIAFGGREALQKMLDLRPNLVLLDLMMPDYTGEDVLAEKQKNPALQDIPVILITARASDQDRLFGLDLGADDFLAKPIAPEELLLRVKNLLQRIRLTRQLALAESREEHALHAELLQHTARSLLRSFSDQDPPANMIPAALEILAPWWHSYPVWKKFCEGCLSSAWTDSPSSPKNYPLPNRDHGLETLRTLRLDLLALDWDEPKKAELWQTWLSTPKEWLHAFHVCLDSQRKIMELKTKGRRVENLLTSLLSLEKIAQEDQTGDPKLLSELALKLFQPRLEEIGVRVECEPLHEQMTLTFSSQNFLLLSLHVLSYLCDQLAQVHRDDKWLRQTWSHTQSEVLLTWQHGGPFLSQKEIEEYFQQTNTTTQTEQQGIHGLYEARRLAQLGSGNLIFQTHQKTRLLVLTLPRALEKRG